MCAMTHRPLAADLRFVSPRGISPLSTTGVASDHARTTAATAEVRPRRALQPVPVDGEEALETLLEQYTVTEPGAGPTTHHEDDGDNDTPEGNGS
jgi:hypothetical protein